MVCRGTNPLTWKFLQKLNSVNLMKSVVLLQIKINKVQMPISHVECPQNETNQLLKMVLITHQPNNDSD